MFKITDKKWWAMCDAGMSRPVQLPKAILHRPFVYCREYGLFYVPSSYHQQAMSLLLAWELGFDKGIQAAVSLGLSYSQETADLWLKETPGATVFSSVGNVPYAHNRDNLNAHELKWFGEVDFIY